MTVYISTDSGSFAKLEEFDNLAEALRDFGCPKKVIDADSFEEWLNRVGGYGFIEVDGKQIAEVAS